MASPSLSIIIPTFKRPDYLQRCLRSCIEQDILPNEIIIGDDSPDEKTAQMIASYQVPERINLRYIHNTPPKGQALNVANLFKEASCEVIGLIHDDDFFFPNVFGALLSPFKDNTIVASFGKHMICDDNEVFREKESADMAERFFKTQKQEGIINTPLLSAYSQQFPNNSFFVRNSPAVAQSYEKAATYQNACDAIFPCILAQEVDGPFYFINQYTAAYRESELSICRGDHIDDSVVKGYWGTYNLKGFNYNHPQAVPTRNARSLGAASCLLRQRKYFQALSVIFGRHLGWRLFFTLNGWRWIYRELWSSFIKGLKNE